MTLKHIPQLKLNNIELKILNTIAEGRMGLTLGLTYKNNPTPYPILICKIYKHYPNWVKNNLQNYKVMYEKGFSPKLLGIQHTEYKFYNICKIKKGMYTCEYNKDIYFYEIGGICTLKQFIQLSSLVNYKNYNLIMKYIDITIKKSILLSSKLNIIHTDLHISNIMIFNENTIYLFNKFIIYDKIQDKEELNKKIKYFKKIVINFLLNKNENKSNSNKNLINSSNDLNLSYGNKSDIKIIDCDRIRNINTIIKTYTSKYDTSDNQVKEIISFIYYTLHYLNVIKFLDSIPEFLKELYKNIYIEKLINKYQIIFNKYTNELYNKSKLYNELGNDNMKYCLFNVILKGIHFAQTPEQYDILYNFIKNKEYINFYNNNLINSKHQIKHIRKYIKELIEN